MKKTQWASGCQTLLKTKTVLKKVLKNYSLISSLNLLHYCAIKLMWLLTVLVFSNVWQPEAHSVFLLISRLKVWFSDGFTV